MVFYMLQDRRDALVMLCGGEVDGVHAQQSLSFQSDVRSDHFESISP